MQVELYKKTGSYFNEEKKRNVPFTNYFVKCNDMLIPIEVKYFPNEKLNNRDPAYSGRVAVMSAFAELLPEKDNNSGNEVVAVSAPPPSDADVPPLKF
jgi:hypothetical protein